MEQAYINYLLGIVCVLLGAILKTLWDSVKELRNADTRLADRVGSVEMLVAGNYVTRADFRADLSELTSMLSKKLDRIEMKVDGKADK